MFAFVQPRGRALTHLWCPCPDDARCQAEGMHQLDMATAALQSGQAGLCPPLLHHPSQTLQCRAVFGKPSLI